MKYFWTLLLLLLYSPSLVWAEGFGHDGEGASFTSIEDRIYANISSPASSGTLDSIKAYITVTEDARDIKLAIYQWSDTSFVDSTEIISVPAGEGWVYFDFVNHASITASTEYALAITAQSVYGDCSIDYSSTGGSYARQIPFIYGVWPTPKWTTVNATGAYEFSIYCFYTTEEPEAAGAFIMINH